MKSHTGGSRSSAICNATRTQVQHKMSDMISDTEKDGKERSIAWCINPLSTPDFNFLPYPRPPYETEDVRHIHHIGNVIIGTERTIGYEQIDCDDGDELGDFHTHPSGVLEPSLNDYTSYLQKDRAISCVGGIVRDGANTENEPEVICDCIDTHHDRYDRTKAAVVSLYRAGYEGVRDEFFDAIESGEPPEIVTEAHLKVLEYYDILEETLDDAISKGVIKRCAVSSNML